LDPLKASRLSEFEKLNWTKRDKNPERFFKKKMRKNSGKNFPFKPTEFFQEEIS